MKVKYHISSLALSLLPVFFTSLLAQEYTPFYIADSKWVMTKVTPVIGPEDCHSYWENYTLHDTVIDGRTYTILARRNLCNLCPDLSGALHADTDLNTSEMIVGGLREENKKVYVLYFSTHIEHLLYDFDVVVGDTIYFTPTIFTIIRELNPPVNGIVNYDVTNSTAFAYPYETGILAEGIGSSYGLFGSYDSFLTDLLCFARGEDAISLADQCTPCAYYMPVSNNDPKMTGSGSVIIYPNPTGGILTVEANQEINIQEISVMDITGKLLLKNSYTTNQVELDLSGFQPSILLLGILLDNNIRVVQRVVKY